MRLFATLTVLTGLSLPVCAIGDQIESMRVETADGYVLKGEFWKPRKKGRAPAALLLHDTLRDRSDFADIAALLNKRGFAVLSIDLRGHGQSTTEKFDFARLEEEQQARSWTLAIRDLEACAGWLRKRSDVHASNLSLVAHGASSILAARYAERDENVRSLVLLVPTAHDLARDLPRSLRRVAGLPTLIVTEKGGRADATRLVEASFKEEDIDLADVVEISVMRAEKTDLMRDKRLPATVSAFLRKHAITEN